MTNRKEHEPIDLQDLKNFALFHQNGRPKSETAKLIMLRAACLLKIKGGTLPLISCTRSLTYSERQDPRWFQWHFADAEATQLIQILASSLEDHE